MPENLAVPMGSSGWSDPWTNPSAAGGPTMKPVGTVASHVVAGAIETSTVPGTNAPVALGTNAPAAKPDAVPERTTAVMKPSVASAAGMHH